MRIALLPAVALLLSASEWPRFRGPDGSGVSTDTGLPVEFSKDRNLVWRLKTPPGNSSPVVAGGRVYLTAHEGDRRIVIAADAANGKLLWQREIIKARSEGFHPINGPVTPTPAAEQDAVYVFFPEFGLLSYSGAGDERWRTPLGPFSSLQGMAASPVVAGGIVILQADQTRDSYLAAFDARTGKAKWRVERPSSFVGAHATPTVHQPARGPAVVIAASVLELAAFRLSDGGKVWFARNVVNGPAANPIVLGDRVLTLDALGDDMKMPFEKMLTPDIDSGGKIEVGKVKDQVMYRLYREADRIHGNGDGLVDAAEWTRAERSGDGAGGLAMINLGGAGDITQSHIRWRVKRSIAYVTSPLYYNGVIYIVNNGGIVTTVNPENGEIFQQARLKDAMEPYYASPVAADGKVYFVSEEGKVTVVKAGPKWELLATNDLGERAMATPAIASGRLYIRTHEALYCFAQKAR